ncbi:hypothetical protein [Streptomyces sp. BE230]|uniref:hypothetical protein n=1 Tax=Streptomyces sp. BE230 TaxID=3002526 RepID=UPI002ED2BA96|nr:hypothetical protein [Streptomyces sp. BE230]
MASLRTRSALLAAALLAGTALLTACQSDTGDEASSATTSSASATASSTEAAAEAEDSSRADSNADASASSGTEAPAAESDSSDTDKAGSGSTPESTGDGAGQGKGASGTWFGNVSYLAPGKYTVSGPKGEEQAFFTSEDTEIWGAGDICGDENGQSATKCTEQELDAAAQKGVSAEVKISDGIATRITDDH